MLMSQGSKVEIQRADWQNCMTIRLIARGSFTFFIWKLLIEIR
ncbi:hypothetical protein ACP70R_009085 [Stipagrostis hirtigluma subsp. patula]